MHPLHFALPEKVFYKGKEYRLKTSFENILKSLALEDEEGLDALSILEIRLELLVGEKVALPIREQAELLNEVIKLYFPPQRTGDKPKKSFDFIQDSEYIYAAFMQDYGIDLYDSHGKLHWLKFFGLFKSLSQQTKFSQIVGIRTRELPKPTKHNNEERQWLLKQKAIFALEMSEEEREERMQLGLRKMADMLISQAKKG